MIQSSSRLEKLKAQQAKIAAQIQRVEAREKSQERKRETRRKILIGSYFLEEAKKNKTMDQLKAQMAEFLTRDSDQALFQNLE